MIVALTPAPRSDAPLGRKIGKDSPLPAEYVPGATWMRVGKGPTALIARPIVGNVLPPGEASGTTKRSTSSPDGVRASTPPSLAPPRSSAFSAKHPANEAAAHERRRTPIAAK